MTDVEAALAAAGFVAADEEAAELVAAGGGDADLLGSLLDRRLSGEPLAWVTGRTRFAGLDVRVDAGVYVPRWQSTELATRAARRLPEDGAAIDLCTGTGAVAMALAHTRPVPGSSPPTPTPAPWPTPGPTGSTPAWGISSPRSATTCAAAPTSWWPSSPTSPRPPSGSCP